MKRAAVAVLLALIASPPTLASSGLIEVTARLQHSNVARLPPLGRGGDAFSSVSLIRDRYGSTIGDLIVDCRWVTTNLRLCVGQVSMPLGTLAVIGASRTRFLGQLAVVGGTGHYVGANGTLLFKAIGVHRYVVSIQYESGSP